MSRNFEKLIEYIINSDETNARKLFHEIVVAKSRNIYESFEQEEEMEEGVGEFIDEVETEEVDNFTMEADMEPEGDDMDHDMEPEGDDMGDDMGDDDGDMEDRVVSLEDAMAELEEQFRELMSKQDDEDMSDEEDEDEEEGEEEEEEVEEAFIREYTEKAPKPVTSEEGSVNKHSTVAKKNDMGGTTANIVKGGTEKGRTAPSAKPMGVNDPKAAGKVAFKSQAPKPVSKEVAGTNKDSVLESRKPRTKK